MGESHNEFLNNYIFVSLIIEKFVIKHRRDATTTILLAVAVGFQYFSNKK